METALSWSFVVGLHPAGRVWGDGRLVAIAQNLMTPGLIYGVAARAETKTGYAFGRGTVNPGITTI